MKDRGVLFAKYYRSLPYLTTGDKEIDRIVDIHHLLEECRHDIIRELIDREIRLET